MPPRPRRKTALRNIQNNNENKPALIGIDDSAPRPNTSLSIVPHTSTPARPLARRVRKPVKRTQATSPFPPSSPPFLLSTHREIVEPTLATSPFPDDPFGFLAAERRLKQRAQLQNRSKTAEKGEVGAANTGMAVSESAELLPISDGRPAFATPPQSSTDSDGAELELDLSMFISGTRTPPGHTPVPLAASPRHHRPKRKVISSSQSSEVEDEGGEPLLIPQTPSPMKRTSTVTSTGPASIRRPFADISHLDNSPEKKSTVTAKTKGKKKGVGGGGRSSGPARKKYKTDETLAEEELRGMTEELKELLPSRPKRNAALRKSGAPAVQKAATTKKATAPKKKGKGKAKSQSKKATAKGGEEVVETREGESFVLSGEEREQFEVAREGRREYFKQVDDYVMEEESVYVI